MTEDSSSHWPIKRRYVYSETSRRAGLEFVCIFGHDGLAEAGIEPSVGSRGDSYDNALAESIIGLYKTEVIYRRGPWRGPENVEFATLEVGALVQHATTLGADRKCLPRRIRDELLSVAGRLARDGETQLKQSPENPGRFNERTVSSEFWFKL